MDTEEFEALNLLHYSPGDENGGLLGPPLLVVISLLLVTLRERLLSWHHAARSLTSSLYAALSRLAVRRTYRCCVIGKLNDGVGVMPGRAVMSEQGVQEGTEYAPLRGPQSGTTNDSCL